MVNYQPFDTAGIAPSIAITQLPADVDPNTPGLQLYEGQFIALGISTSDDVQVRDVQLLVNGRVVDEQVSYPWNIETVLPSIAANGSNQLTLQVEAADTGGNTTFSASVQVTLIPDTAPPRILSQDVRENDIELASFHQITYKFSKPLDASTLTADNFRLLGPGGALISPLSLDQAVGSNVVVITYDALLPGQYQAEVDGAVTDTAGLPLGASVNTDFSIEEFSDIWTNPGGGDWTVTSNWSAGVPTASDFVYLNFAGSVTTGFSDITVARLVLAGVGTLNVTPGRALTVTGQTDVTGSLIEESQIFTFGGDTKINQLTLAERNDVSDSYDWQFGALAGAGTVTVTGSLIWIHSDMEGLGTTVVASGATAVLGGQNISLGLSRELEVAGQATLTPNGSLTLGADGTAGTLAIIAGGTFTLATTANETAAVNLNVNVGGNLIVNAGTISETGAGTGAIEVAITNSGVVDVTGGTLHLDGGVNNTGMLNADGGNLIVSGAVAGTATIAEDLVLELTGASCSVNVAFAAGSVGTFRIDQSRTFSGAVSGLGATSTLDLADISFATSSSPSDSGDGTGGTLTVSDGTNTAAIALSGNYLNALWRLSDDGHGGTFVQLLSLTTPTDIWSSSSSGSWATDSNWSTGAAPGAQDDVYLALSSGHTVTSTGQLTIGSLAQNGSGNSFDRGRVSQRLRHHGNCRHSDRRRCLVHGQRRYECQ